VVACSLSISLSLLRIVVELASITNGTICYPNRNSYIDSSFRSSLADDDDDDVVVVVVAAGLVVAF
jgi:hypothetical protein